MTRSRTWTIGTAVVVVLILLAGWFMLVAPKRSHAADLQAQAAAAERTNQQTQVQIKTLQKQQQQLPTAEAQLAQFKVQIPADPLLPAFIRSLVDAADSSGVWLATISPAVPAPLTSQSAVAAPAPTPSPTASGSTATPTTAPAPSQSAGLSAQVYAIDTTLTLTGNYANVEAFVHKLEGMQRSVLVHGMTTVSCDNPPSGAGGGSSSSSSGQAVTCDKVPSLDPASDLLNVTINARIFLDPNLGGSTTATGTGSGN